MKYLIDLQKVRKVAQLGEKARNLHWLHRQGFHIPRTYVLPYSTHAAFRSHPEALLSSLRPELETLLRSKARHSPLQHQGDATAKPPTFAVRSSASLEDSASHSYAGQFITLLDVSGQADALLDAVCCVLAAGDSATVQTYARHTGQETKELKIAVIIQEMVTPRRPSQDLISGVAFSKNPLTGLDDVVVEAVHGSGEQLVQAGKTPERWVFKWGNWLTQPETSSIGLALIELVVRQTQQIAQRFGVPVDLEWVFDGEQLYWVQLRPITCLESINIYSNRIAREVFPGLIKPLIWSVNVPLVNGAWIRLFTEMIGPNDLRPEELAKSFYYHAYFNMGVIGRIFQMLGFPRQSLELLLGFQDSVEKPRFKPGIKTLALLPRLLHFTLGKLGIGRELWPALEQARQEYTWLASQPLQNLTDQALLAEIERLYLVNQKTAYYNIVIPLLMSIYNALFARQLARHGVDFATFDLTRGLAGLQAYDPNLHLKRLADTALPLDDAARAAMTDGDYTRFVTLPGIVDFQAQVAQFLECFGHLSDSGNDFSAVPWRETPGLVLQMIARLAADAGIAPQQASSAPGEQPQPQPHTRTHLRLPSEGSRDGGQSRLTWEALPLTRPQRLAMQPLYQRARQFRLFREAVSSAYTFGYGLFRGYFLELGQRLVQRGVLTQAEDIFFLEFSEVKAAVSNRLTNGEASSTLATIPDDHYAITTAQRKAEQQTSHGLALPELIFGEDLPPPRSPDWQGSVLKGIPSSRGYYRGPARVIRSVADFDRLSTGDVLVIPYSDVSWTPLFTRAGAVIAESGGILSHSSIVAREFNLPCIVSVSHACQIPDQTTVTVDGFKGEVTLDTVL